LTFGNIGILLYKGFEHTTMSVDISGLDRDELLEALWENAKLPDFFAHLGPIGLAIAPAFDLSEAKEEIQCNGYADYICGRPIKTYIYSSDTVDPVPYNGENGQGVFERVVESLRKEGKS